MPAGVSSPWIPPRPTAEILHVDRALVPEYMAWFANRKGYVAPELCRVEMFRYENTYDVLITRHTLSPHQNTRPRIESKIVFFHRAGTHATELWGKDSAFRGGALPSFFKKNGEEEPPPAALLDALLKVTEAVCCVGCKHSHLLEMSAMMLPCYLKQSFAEVGV